MCHTYHLLCHILLTWKCSLMFFHALLFLLSLSIVTNIQNVVILLFKSIPIFCCFPYELTSVLKEKQVFYSIIYFTFLSTCLPQIRSWHYSTINNYNWKITATVLQKFKKLQNFESQKHELAKFYSQALSLNNIIVLPVEDKGILFTQYMIYKVFFIKDKLNGRSCNNQQSLKPKSNYNKKNIHRKCYSVFQAH